MTYQIEPHWCGFPQPGKIYSVIPKENFEFDKLNAFLYDPPLYVPEKLGFTSIATYMVPRVPRKGQQYVEVQDHLGQLVPCALDFFGEPIFDILDTVGKGNYTVVKWLEEVRKQGFHQLVPMSLDFSKLSPESQYLVMHEEAIVMNTDGFPYKFCPTSSHHEPCIGAAWITDREPVGKMANGKDFQAYKRTGNEQFARGIFAHFPIMGFRIYEDLSPEHLHEKALKALDGLNKKLSGTVEFVEMEE